MFNNSKRDYTGRRCSTLKTITKMLLTYLYWDASGIKIFATLDGLFAYFLLVVFLLNLVYNEKGNKEET